MKKINLIIISAVALMAMASCKDMLNTSPANQIGSGMMWTSEDLADQGMVGLYRNFRSTATSYSTSIANLSGNGNGVNRGGFMGLEVQSVWTSGTGMGLLTDAVKQGSAYQASYEWYWAYTGTQRINDAIANLHKAGLSTEKYQRYMAEAKCLRAWYYSRLNKIFQGVPLYLEPVSNEQCTKGQSTSTEIWEAVIDDCTDCIECEYFPDNTLTENYGRASKGMAYSLRGMAYMWLAWENKEDTSYYQLAADDFEQVSKCGYGLWAGNYIDFFNYDNEKDHEMIFPVQFTDDTPHADFLQLIVGPRDCYQGWSRVRPNSNFVDYFQNSDGSTFDWTQRIPEWNDDVFVNDVKKREVFFLRDSISLDDNDEVVRDYWDESQAGQIQERINRFGVDIFKKYYLKDGNEDRLRSVYNDCDPRLKDIVLTPYDPYDCYYYEYNNDQNMYNKELRWPYIKDNKHDCDDVYYGESQACMYAYKKYSYNHKDELVDRLRCPTDWPLIRYTDVYLYLAECYVHLGRLSDAVNIVNEIRTRAKMPSVTVGTSDQVMEAVRYERRVELCMEGTDYFDEWRWGTYKQMKFQGLDVYGIPVLWGEWDGYVQKWYYTDDMWPWGAPQSECQKNPNLTPKDGWAY